MLHLGPVVHAPAHANVDATGDADADTDVDADAAATLTISRIPVQSSRAVQLIQQYLALVILIILAKHGHVVANVYTWAHDGDEQSFFRVEVSRCDSQIRIAHICIELPQSDQGVEKDRQILQGASDREYDRP